MLARLLARTPIDEPVALVAAHPDDETIGMGAMLPLLRNLLLVHVTDGAPRNLADAHAHGFADAPAYAAARERELGAALRTAGISPARVRLALPDQGAAEALPQLTASLQRHLAGIAAVFTHPYEGGHPDHDAAACATSRAARCPVYEFTSYHAAPHGIVTAHFLPGPEPATLALTTLALTPQEHARKRAMLDCFTTQRATLAPFGAGQESFRRAPAYDFTQPPHPGTLHYERHDWGMTGARWRTLANP